MKPELLLTWYDQHKRDLPWRDTGEPYHVLVSEFMLQQTTVGVVIPYFVRWIARFPDIESLASATYDEVLVYWQGLGYYSRARRLHLLAQVIAKQGWPNTVEEWLMMPGVGEYTAGALASIGFGQDAALVDGNVERVFARLFCMESSGAQLKKECWTVASELVPQARAGDWNQALMELGATVCRKAQPQCSICPLKLECQAHKRSLQSVLPKVVAKPKMKALSLVLGWDLNHDGLGLTQFKAGEWWEGLYGLPRLSSEGAMPILARVKHTVTSNKIAAQVQVACVQPEIRVQLTEIDTVAITALDKKAITAVLASLEE